MKKTGLFLRILISIQGLLIGDYLSRSLHPQDSGKGTTGRKRGSYAFAVSNKGKIVMGAKPSQLVFGVLAALFIAPLFRSKLLGAFFSGIGTGFATNMFYGDMTDEEILKAIKSHNQLVPKQVTNLASCLVNLTFIGYNTQRYG